ncbi:MAG: M23 family metallopeptidase [Spirochaetia bacterium]|nr:M23 family metallopeptidase [Spirochaetia bacterium]
MKKKEIFFILISIISFIFNKSELYAEDAINSWQKVKYEVETYSTTEKVFIDNSEIQTYQGMTGIWKKVSPGLDLSTFVVAYQASIDEIISINNLPANSKKIYSTMWLFIPYSQNYIHELEKKGINRLSVDVLINEYIWPIEGIRITSRLGKRWGKFHPGIDIAASLGTMVLAAMDGEVTESKYFGDYGNAVMVNNNSSYLTIYAHLSQILVKKGDKVRKGQLIGFSGNSGHSTGPHLHFEVRYLSVVLNPEVFLPMFKESIYTFARKDIENIGTVEQ